MYDFRSVVVFEHVMEILEALHDSCYLKLLVSQATRSFNTNTALVLILSELTGLDSLVVLIKGTPHVRVCWSKHQPTLLLHASCSLTMAHCGHGPLNSQTRLLHMQ